MKIPIPLDKLILHLLFEVFKLSYIHMIYTFFALHNVTCIVWSIIDKRDEVPMRCPVVSFAI